MEVRALVARVLMVVGTVVQLLASVLAQEPWVVLLPQVAQMHLEILPVVMVEVVAMANKVTKALVPEVVVDTTSVVEEVEAVPTQMELVVMVVYRTLLLAGVEVVGKLMAVATVETPDKQVAMAEERAVLLVIPVAVA